jgi:pyruvate,water dikinase
MKEEKKEKIRVWDAAPGFEFNEEVDLREMHSWFLQATHCVPPWTPLFGWFWVNYAPHGTKAAAEKLSLSACKGWDFRYHDGGSYISLHVVRDEKEIAERTVKFKEALRPYLEDWDGYWEACKKELLSIYAPLKEIDIDNASHVQLIHHHYDLKLAYMRMWEIHHEAMEASHSAYFLLTQMAKEDLGIRDQDPEFQAMLAGFPNKVYDMDKDMWQFGQVATEMGLGDMFKENTPTDIVSKLQETDKGKDWFKKFMNYLETDEIGGWRMRRATDFTEPYWLEDPATPIGVIRDFIRKGTDYDLETVRAKHAKRREEAIADFLAKVPPDKKGLYEGLVGLSGKLSAFSEEHDLYCELMSQAIMRRSYLGMGRIVAEKGAIDQPEDIFFLGPDEIDRVLMVPETYDMRWLTRRRRAEWEEWCTRPNPLFFTDRGSFEGAVMNDLLPSQDAIALYVVVGEIPEAKPEMGADLFGLCGCSGEGEIEGVARVAISYSDLSSVQPGEILVCGTVNPAWTPVFGIVKGVIADSGGTLSHTAIIGREYGIPTIVNTHESTAKIKTGMHIRMDAKDGAVYILDK